MTFYVARKGAGWTYENGFETVLDPIEFWNLGEATSYQTMLYNTGIVAPIVVRADNRSDAQAKAERCYAGELTTRQAKK